MKFTILLILITVLTGCEDKSARIEAQQAAAAKQLRDGSNIVSSSPKNWTWGDTPSQPQKKDQ
ncbi:hypothetical protein AB870_10440 [Pandoraea faecigallinarum]|uniref:Lipoprotein n=2 Tax=Pandoraea TaxID=93217 RepID=A0A5E4UQK9_9BURK|nr:MULTISPECIES: hypothetical protein [Burkholderiaceae]AKM30436.1 hypothetical protein AB870_10440 [Pandoraea faecigallinarum]PRG17612.1 hypothetical protein C6Q35_29210 [Burkholderia multivorans]PRG66989.1 hypothetical protein C6T69_19105 [Burkholderia multivorans]TXD05187.1 hypothetical protein FTI75_07810 [Burkholderia pseudomallei]VVE01175.1 hypothetical protein PNO31109_02125 [Pandoraea nosoerga]